MQIGEEQLKHMKQYLPDKISLEVLQKVVEKLPDQAPVQSLMPVIADAVGSLSETASDEQKVSHIMRHLQNMGKKSRQEDPGDSKKITRAYFDDLKVEMRLIDSVEPDTTVRYFGHEFSSPVMTTALSHLGTFHQDWDSPMERYAKGAAQANVMHWVGMIENTEYERLTASGAKMVRIVKPYADEKKIIDQLKMAEETGAIAVGMDLDHTFTKNGNLDVVMGQKMAVKSREQLQAYAKATSLPFIIKGVLSVTDAVKCKEMGVDAIVVSHHGGRMPYAVPPLMVLPEIRKAVGDAMLIFVDCGIQSGLDAYKAMALGADGVCVGTHLVPYIKESVDAVADRLQEMNAEMKGMMAYTNVPDCRSFDASVLHR